MIENLLLDIDGVCNCFHRHVFRHLGLPYPDDSHYPVDCGWDIVAAANRLAGYERFTPDTFWRSITREVWAESPVSPEFGCLLEHAEWLVGREHVHFLTSPTLNADSLAGKLDWIQRCAPAWMHRQFLIGPSKHLCAKPGAVLFDDSDKNVEAFRAAGGCALLVPRPWNSSHGLDAEHEITVFFQHVMRGI